MRLCVGCLTVARRLFKFSHRKEKTWDFFRKNIKSLDDLFVHQLQDIYYAEK